MDGPPRRARPADAEHVCRIARTAFARYTPRLGRPPREIGLAYPSLIQRGQVIVVDGPEALAGFALAIPRDDTLIIEVLAVDPAFQHRGIGRRLIVHAEAQARISGMRRIDLAVDEMMWETLGLYARLGYQEIDRREQEGSVRVQFRKYLGWHP